MIVSKAKCAALAAYVLCSNIQFAALIMACGTLRAVQVQAIRKMAEELAEGFPPDMDPVEAQKRQNMEYPELMVSLPITEWSHKDLVNHRCGYLWGF